MYQKILVPLDGSEFAECALDHVMRLSRKGNMGEVILLHVLDPIQWCRDGHDFVAFRNFQFSQAEKYLDGIKSRLGLEGIKVESKLSVGGLPAPSIIQYAEENAVDLIVIASHGRTGLKKLMLGSVALEILHDSHVPVLLIRP